MKQKVITRISRKSLYKFKSLIVLLLVLTAGFGILFGSSTIFSSAAQEITQTENQIKNKNLRQPIVTRKSDEVFDRLIEAARVGGTARVIVGLPVDFAPENDLNEETANRQRVEIRAAQDDLLGRLAPYAVEGVKQFDFIPFMAFEADADALEFLKNSSEVNFIQEDKPYAASLAQSVSLVGATNAWNDGFTGNGQTIAILDSGVDKSHPLLADKVISEACYSTNANNAASFCPGGASASTESNSGLHCLGADGCQHGTHVAGIAAGRNGEANLNGVAKDANIIAIQVFTRFNDAANCDGMEMPCAKYLPSDVIRGLERVYELRNDYNIAAVNLSLGGGRHYSTCDAAEAATKTIIDNLRAAKIATIVASGNDGWTNSMDAPACISTAISVGSTRDENLSGGNVDTVSAFSNSAPFLSLLAPGENINSSIPGGGYASYPGTSMASPHVAGAFAILKSRSPNSSVTQIFNALDATGIAVTDSRNNVTKKRIKIDAALNALPGNDKIVFVNKTNNSYDIYTMNADGTNRFRVTNDGSEKKSPSFSPDGKKILYDGVDGFYTINADGTNPVRVYNSYYANNPSFSPDGTKIVFSEDRQIYTINADGSSLRQITNLNGVALTPSWSPDGTKITFSAYEAPFFTYAVWVINADGTGVVKLTGTSFTALAPRFSPDGTKIVFYVSNSGAFEGINIINSNGSSLNNPTRITTTWRDKDPSFSSDGSRILFVNDSPPDYIPSIYTINADGTNRKLVGIADDQFFPNWYLPVAQNSASMATTVGQNIPAPLNDTVSLVFDNVTTAGNTIATALAANQLQPLPSGFTLPANAPKYEIATSANFTGSVNVTFNVPGIAGAAACSPLRILHYTNNVWDSANNAAPIFNAGTGVCTLRQTVTSLSPFVVAQQAFSPTSAPVTVSGRVSAASGRGVRGARVTITGPNGEQRITVSNSLGYYLFADVAAGATYVFSVSAKGRVFQNPTQARTIIEDTSDVNFVAAN